jgi:hypothetical protein
VRFIKKSKRANPKVSLVLLDWSVRESFHLLHYLANQAAGRDSFEVIVIEYYSRVSDAVREFEDQVDTWVTLDMPEACYYHKHLMYNVGIVLSRAGIVMIGDSDAMVRPTFIQTIIERFERTPDIVYHMDQFRNVRKEFYPFSYPSFDEVTGRGCINITDGQTTGLLDDVDPIHSRNYGACMCARREDLIRIGGADEHVDYLGHICGPYDMTFRLVNLGRQEVWETEEFMYHTWHPGSAGVDNYLGPHDGRHMSTTSFEALISGRAEPLVENQAIRVLRTDRAKSSEEVLDLLINPDAHRDWVRDSLETGHVRRAVPDRFVPLELYGGYRLFQCGERVCAYRVVPRSVANQFDDRYLDFVGADIDDVKRRIRSGLFWSFPLIQLLARIYTISGSVLFLVRRRSLLLPGKLPAWAKIAISCVVGLAALPLILILQPRRVANIVRNVFYYGNREARNLGSLAALVARLEAASENAGSEFLVLTQTAHAFAFLRLLASLGAISRKTAVQRLRTGPEYERCLDQVDRRGWGGFIILPSALFTVFHTLSVRYKIAERMLVV